MRVKKGCGFDDTSTNLALEIATSGPEPIAIPASAAFWIRESKAEEGREEVRSRRCHGSAVLWSSKGNCILQGEYSKGRRKSKYKKRLIYVVRDFQSLLDTAW